MKVNVFDLQIGDIVVEDVFNAAGLILLNANTRLTAQDIAFLKKHQVDYVKIQCTEVPRISHPQNNPHPSLQDSHQPESNDNPIHKLELSDRLSPFTMMAYMEATDRMKDIFENALMHDHIDASSVNAALFPLLSNIKLEKDIVALLLTLDSDVDYTFQHSVQVCIISYFLAIWMDMSEEEAKLIGKAGLLHDIGKCKVDPHILSKPARLTEDEFAEVTKHTMYGYQLIKRSLHNEDLAAVALQHHERYNGLGYPDKRSGEDIHPYARIIAVADVYSAMISTRVYQAKRDLLYVLKELYDMSFTQLDPYIVQVFIRNMLPNFIGKKVTLKDGSKGTIIMTNPTDFFRPLIQVGTQFIDLSRQNHLQIETVLMK